MKSKINKRLIETAAMAILSTLLLTAAVCYHTFKNQVMDDLKGYAGIIKCIFEDRQDSLPDNGEAFTEENIRITLIQSDGTVLYDTLADAKNMENHLNRPEVKSALDAGEGSIIRQSDTLDQNTYYYAVRLEGGQVLRVARDADSIYTIMQYAVPYLLIIAVVLFIICCISSWFLAEGLIRPMKLIAQDINNIGKTETYEELKPYIDAVKKQHDDVLKNALMRQEFTANVSHELKTPLAAISGYSELIEKGMASSESETIRFAGEIHKNANRLLTLINDVIRLSELDAESDKESLEPVNLREIAETCVNMLGISAEKHHVTLTFEGEDAVIMATKQMAEEVLYNLCDNAIRYNKEGGSVWVIIKDKPDTVVLTVKDMGIGIPKEHQERIFERFYRVDKSRSKSTGGTGLGLAIVKHILLRLDAGISLESVEGEGTEITVTFPAVKEAQFK